MKKLIFTSGVAAILACTSGQASLVIGPDGDATFHGANGVNAPVPIVSAPLLLSPSGNVLSVKTSDDGFGTPTPDATASQYAYIHFSLPGLGSPVASATLNLTYYLPTSPSSSGMVTLLGIAEGAAGDIAAPWVESASTGFYSGSDIVNGNANLKNLGSFSFGSTPANKVPFSITSSLLAQFLNSDVNGGVTFILFRNVDNNNFGFNAHEAGVLGTPSMSIDFAAPEPTTYGLVGGGFCLAMYGGLQLFRRRQTALIPA
ncbi:MAG: hypothetical protein WCO56_01655 [Verrucomicrobiota bacterium]